jgi:hypothetical protein
LRVPSNMSYLQLYALSKIKSLKLSISMCIHPIRLSENNHRSQTIRVNQAINIYVLGSRSQVTTGIKPTKPSEFSISLADLYQLQIHPDSLWSSFTIDMRFIQIFGTSSALLCISLTPEPTGQETKSLGLLPPDQLMHRRAGARGHGRAWPLVGTITG